MLAASARARVRAQISLGRTAVIVSDVWSLYWYTTPPPPPPPQLILWRLQAVVADATAQALALPPTVALQCHRARRPGQSRRPQRGIARARARETGRSAGAETNRCKTNTMRAESMIDRLNAAIEAVGGLSSSRLCMHAPICRTALPCQPHSKRSGSSERSTHRWNRHLPVCVCVCVFVWFLAPSAAPFGQSLLWWLVSAQARAAGATIIFAPSHDWIGHERREACRHAGRILYKPSAAKRSVPCGLFAVCRTACAVLAACLQPSARGMLLLALPMRPRRTPRACIMH